MPLQPTSWSRQLFRGENGLDWWIYSLKTGCQDPVFLNVHLWLHGEDILIWPDQDIGSGAAYLLQYLFGPIQPLLIWWFRDQVSTSHPVWINVQTKFDNSADCFSWHFKVLYHLAYATPWVSGHLFRDNDSKPFSVSAALSTRNGFGRSWSCRLVTLFHYTIVLKVLHLFWNLLVAVTVGLELYNAILFTGFSHLSSISQTEQITTTAFAYFR